MAVARSISNVVVNKLANPHKIRENTSFFFVTNADSTNSNINFNGYKLYVNGTAINYSSVADTNIKAMGGPTIQLFANSWNIQHSNKMLYYALAENGGYYVGLEENPTTTEAALNINDALYFPSMSTDYWFASGAAQYGGLIKVWWYKIDKYNWNNQRDCRGALRPVICLPSSLFE